MAASFLAALWVAFTPAPTAAAQATTTGAHRGCFLRIKGRAEFDRAEVLFADGQLEPIELRGARRGRGLYELVRWPQARTIACVRLRVRARSEEARLELVFGE